MVVTTVHVKRDFPRVTQHAETKAAIFHLRESCLAACKHVMRNLSPQHGTELICFKLETHCGSIQGSDQRIKRQEREADISSRSSEEIGTCEAVICSPSNDLMARG